MLLTLAFILAIWPFHHNHKPAPPPSPSAAANSLEGAFITPSQMDLINNCHALDPDDLADPDGTFTYYYVGPDGLLGFGPTCEQARTNWRFIIPPKQYRA